MPSSVRTFLLRPSAFFEQRRDQLNGGRGVGLALGAAVALTAVIGIALRLFAAQFTGTTEIDNPARPPEQMCEDGAVGEMTVAGCDEPATKTVEIGSLFWDQASEALPALFVGLILVWLGITVALYVGANIAGGTGGFGETMEIAAWGLIPAVVTVAVGGAALVLFTLRMNTTGGDPAQLRGTVQALQRGSSGLSLLAVQIGGAIWQAYLWADGVAVVHDISRKAAAAIAVTVAIVLLLVS